MALKDVKNELLKLDKAKLIEIIAELYRKQKLVKEYFDYFTNPDEKAEFEKYKNKVREAFFPKRGVNFKLSAGKKQSVTLKPKNLLRNCLQN
jgi:Family of unknown function (DUF6155)